MLSPVEGIIPGKYSLRNENAKVVNCHINKTINRKLSINVIIQSIWITLDNKRIESLINALVS